MIERDELELLHDGFKHENCISCQYRSAETQCWGHVCICTSLEARRHNVDSKPKARPLKLILMFNEKVMLLACSVLRQIIAGV